MSANEELQLTVAEETSERRDPASLIQVYEEWKRPSKELRDERRDFYGPLADRLVQVAIEKDISGENHVSEAMKRKVAVGKWKGAGAKAIIGVKITQALQEVRNHCHFLLSGMPCRTKCRRLLLDFAGYI